MQKKNWMQCAKCIKTGQHRTLRVHTQSHLGCFLATKFPVSDIFPYGGYLSGDFVSRAFQDGDFCLDTTQTGGQKRLPTMYRNRHITVWHIGYINMCLPIQVHSLLYVNMLHMTLCFIGNCSICDKAHWPDDKILIQINNQTSLPLSYVADLIHASQHSFLNQNHWIGHTFLSLYQWINQIHPPPN